MVDSIINDLNIGSGAGKNTQQQPQQYSQQHRLEGHHK